ncbi:uncharacterized protein LOC128735293 [Sabethes cyaneus]|uniref:uncharacterized protein LOC128735292 n=1 Tax=Sabethes cyaneus TaxID=53552 RepID=UPI00237EB5A4|nr:uncharacterized protein LOC128735292 [Sabethes cyaneus]XP_053685760.1 uncharacterized protein LOC128735293 [Sabethes cyaneus]
MENLILENVSHRRAAINTKYHCLYGYYFLGLSRSQLATIYKKSKSTISFWITEYEQEGTLCHRKRQSTFRKFDADKRAWLINQYRKNPILYLDEARQRFTLHFGVSISASSICNILRSYGMTWKVLERRAMQIRQKDIERYTQELDCFKWDLHQLLFLDEVSFANRELVRNRGYEMKGQKLVFRGEFCRKPRVSCLCFLGQSGIVECFETEGTFTRQKFFDCCRKMALFNNNVRSYPGKFSVWVMDGACIHCDANIIQYLRSLGIIPLFLPAYCPFYNPIEVIFGLVKKYLKRNLIEGDKTPLSNIIQAALTKFTLYDCTKRFAKCGYVAGGKFNSLVSQ